MSNIYFTSDWHLGHKGIIKYRQGFSTHLEQEQLLINNYNSVISKNDTVYFLGDMCTTPESVKLIKQLKGRKFLIPGNHDVQDARLLLTAFDDVFGPIKYKGYWLSHHPIHPQELYGKKNIHGHTHNQVVMLEYSECGRIQDTRYINVCPEHTNYTPMSFDKIQRPIIL